MSFNSNEDALNFLLDEFFIYRGLEELEKNSKNQENELELLMQNTCELLNEIKKMKLNIHIKKKAKACTYNNSYGNIKNKIPYKIDKNKIENRKQNDINTIFKKKYLYKSNIKRNETDYNTINQKKNKNKNVIILRRQYTSNYYTTSETTLTKYNRSYLSARNIKTENKQKEKNKSKNKSIKHFTISLLD